jgi:rhodanese-related sulfurtransferase
MNQAGFRGDISPQQAWTALEETADAVLIDVRSSAEWAFVGGPDLSSVDKTVRKIEWQKFPGMARNEAFVDEVLALGIGLDQPLFFLCRSGVRSKAAALALAEKGYATYNIDDGFEGPLNPAGHRTLGGWRGAGLPWRQT